MGRTFRNERANPRYAKQAWKRAKRAGRRRQQVLSDRILLLHRQIDEAVELDLLRRAGKLMRVLIRTEDRLDDVENRLRKHVVNLPKLPVGSV